MKGLIKMRIALASSSVITKDVEHNLESMLSAITSCRGKADLVVFGEDVLQGFDCLCWDYKQDCKTAVSKDNSLIFQICQSARQNQTAVSFGYIEKTDGHIFSSQLVVDASGSEIYNFRRLSPGWKEPKADAHYIEGAYFSVFQLEGKRFSIGLCGDLWYTDHINEMRKLQPDVILWPVWCDYNPVEWNQKIKYEYAKQASLCGHHVLLVNPFCEDAQCAAGGSAFFQNGLIKKEIPAGRSSILIVEI